MIILPILSTSLRHFSSKGWENVLLELRSERVRLISDGLCLGIVGEVGEASADDGATEKEFYIWTHKKFDIGYNGNQIVDVNLTSESKTKLSPDSKISFTYEVQ